MKRMMTQILRLVMTMIIMSTMAVMIFSLREQRDELQRQIVQLKTAAEPGLFATIRDRTSVRRFDPAVPVSDEAIEKILRAGMCAPSALNKQPWAFVVVRDAAVLKALGDALPNSRVGNGARAAIAVCGDLETALPGKARDYWIHDCSAATMNMLLAAKALGLGAVWTGVYPIDDRVATVRKILALPASVVPLNIIPLGHPAENPRPKDKWSPSKIHRDRW